MHADIALKDCTAHMFTPACLKCYLIAGLHDGLVLNRQTCTLGFNLICYGGHDTSAA